MKPTPDQIERAANAHVPFIHEWKLPLNPEDLQEIAYAALVHHYAVLVHHDSDEPWEQIDAAVRDQIAEARRDQEQIREQMEQRRHKLH